MSRNAARTGLRWINSKHPAAGIAPVRAHNQPMPDPVLANSSPAAGFDQPFEMLDACHQRIANSLTLLQRLVQHLKTQAVDSMASSAACDVMRYFDLAAPQHHLDEERHVFPQLEASGDERLVALARRLRAEHDHFEADWAQLWPLLEQVAHGRDVAWPEFKAAAQHFVRLHAEHLADESNIAFPYARAAIANRDPLALESMGTEMADRRGAHAAGVLIRSAAPESR